MLSDTVRFIRRLPHTLVAAFRATLEETVHADLLLHVVDASSADRDAQIHAVNQVLAEIGAERIPQVLIYNKIDLTVLPARLVCDDCGKIAAVWASAQTDEGLDFVRQAIGEQVAAGLRSPALSHSAAA